MAIQKRSARLLCLIQRAETTWEREGRIQGSTDLPATKEGLIAVREAFRQTRTEHIATVYHPDSEAALSTAKLVAAEIKAKTKKVANLSDPNLGVLEGLSLKAFPERFPKRFRQWKDDLLSLSPPDGEEIRKVRSRIFLTVAGVLKRSRSEEVGLVLPPIATGFLRCYLAERPLNELWSMQKSAPLIERYCLSMDQLHSLEGDARQLAKSS